MKASRLDPNIPTIFEAVTGDRSMAEINHGDVIQRIHDAHPPAKTIDGALAFLLRAIATLQQAFPQERVGLLIKTAGENIAPFQGTSVSAGRIVYPDHNLLVKILSDVPSTNGASWQPEEGIPDTGHHGGYLAVPVNWGPPDDDDDEDDPPAADTLRGEIAQLQGQLNGLADLMVVTGERLLAQEALHKEVNKQLGKHNDQIADIYTRVSEIANRPDDAPSRRPSWWPF